MNRKVLVFGATGKTGIKICEQLREHKISHIAFVRKPLENKMVLQNTELIYGNVLNVGDIEKAFKANVFTDIVIALGSRDLKNTKIRSTGTKNIVEVLSKLSINCKIHVISALGVGESWAQLDWFGKLICKVLINNTMKDHAAQEEIVINSTYKYHILRPVGLTDGDLTGKTLNQTQGFLPNNQISRADVAKYLVESLINEKIGFSSICKSN